MKIFYFKSYNPLPYESKWEAPSNIAIIKYWGKKKLQIPKNPSLSFTLDKSVTRTSIRFEPSESGKFKFKFFFNGSLKLILMISYMFSLIVLKNMCVG